MRTMSLLLCLLFCALSIRAQKKPLIPAAYKNWPQVTHPLLSPDKGHLLYQLTDSTAVIYSLRTKTSDSIAIPFWKKHLQYAFDTLTGAIVFQHLVEKPKPPRPPIKGVSVDLWSWNDSVLQSAQLYRLTAPDSFVKKVRLDMDVTTPVNGDSVTWAAYHPVTNVVDQALKKKFARRMSKHFSQGEIVRIIGRLNKKEFVLERSTATAPVDLFRTKKFKKFEQLTDVHPEREWNWYTVDSLRVGRGLLDVYKPEDFNPWKKYPVILCLSSERLTGLKGTGLYQPILSNGLFNIPYFASNGYVVVDLPATITSGRPGPAILEQVQSVLAALHRYTWVDTSKLALQGHGVPAYFVNYIVTQTRAFAAAESSAGVNDLISHYGSVDGRGDSFQDFYDKPGGFFGKTLWEDSAAYIWQSPVMLADKIWTPLLMLHNKEDMVTPFAQGIELFTGMRRLGNRCWMLQYDGEGHTLLQPRNQEDFTIRLQQFFDHYLKDSLPRTWMTRGIPARKKGIDNGFAIDHDIPTPPIGALLNDAEYKKRFGDRPRDKSKFDLTDDDNE